MVIYIKDSPDNFMKERADVNGLEKIAQTMINIESNKYIFNQNFEKNNDPSLGFNKYESNGVIYEVSNPTYGVVLLYLNHDCETYSQRSMNGIGYIISRLDATLRNLGTYSDTSVKDYSAPYTLITKNQVQQRHLYSSKNYHKSIISSGQNVFIWDIVVVDHCKDALQVPGYSMKSFSAEYLSQALTTIIYDVEDIFDLPYKQMNYPSLEQYKLFKRNRINTELITINNKYGLELEFSKVFNKYTYADTGLVISEAIKFESLKIRRVIPNKDWINTLKEPYNYEKQERDEVELAAEGKPVFPNDVCFISRMPLSSLAIAVLIKNNENNEESCILISPAMQYVEFNSIPNSLPRKHYYDILDANKFTINGRYFVEYPRPALEVIDMLPNITPEKKKILKAIEKYGIFKNTANSDITYTTLDVDNKEIFIGLSRFDDHTIRKYNKTHATLYYLIYHES